jgi:hypothetical protein
MFGEAAFLDKRELARLAPRRPISSMSTFDPAVQLPHLRALCRVIDRLIEGQGDALRMSAPAISGWTAEEQIAHVALANELILRNLKNFARGSGALIVRGGEPIPQAIPILVSGKIPRGLVQSPRMVRPPAAFDRELFLGWVADDRREIEALDPATIRADELRIPHQALGPLDAPQWLRFAVVHTRHHLAIATEILRAAGAEDGAELALPMI